MGFGFEERNDAFDFNVTLNDFKTRNDEVKVDDKILNAEKQDFSLKEGQKIKINIAGKKKVFLVLSF